MRKLRIADAPRCLQMSDGITETQFAVAADVVTEINSRLRRAECIFRQTVAVLIKIDFVFFIKRIGRGEKTASYQTGGKIPFR